MSGTVNMMMSNTGVKRQSEVKEDFSDMYDVPGLTDTQLLENYSKLRAEISRLRAENALLKEHYICPEGLVILASRWIRKLGILGDVMIKILVGLEKILRPKA